MGQRGYRKRRARCAFVDPRTGLRCRVQVKKAGSKFCCLSHAARSRSKVSQVTEPGARAIKAAARRRAYDEVAQALRAYADEHGRVPLTAVLAVVFEKLDSRYDQGYHAGLVIGQRRARQLRLTKSREFLNEFVASRFGKGFMMGELSPEALARFEFGGSR